MKNPSNSTPKTFFSPWQHFTKGPKGSNLAYCSLCPKPKELRTKNSGTTGLIRHLISIHKMTQSSAPQTEKDVSGTHNASHHSGIADIETNSVEECSAPKKQKLQQSLDRFVKVEKDSFNAIISELVAKDGLSFNQVAHSRLIKKMIAKEGYTPSKSPSTLTKHLHEEAERIRDELCVEVASVKNKGEKFSTSIDEQTTAANYRILNVQLYSKTFSANLGMIVIKGSCPAEKLEEMTNFRLERYGLDPLYDIIGSTTDGSKRIISSVMIMEFI